MATDPDELAFHVAKALRLYFRHEKRNGRTVPVAVLDVARYILASPMRQEATNLGDRLRAAEAERMSEELLTKKQAAAELGGSVRTLERIVAAGDLVVVRVGRSVRIRRADLRAYVASRRSSFREAVELKEGA
jgi:excisionase family DNA binding protein